MVLDPRYKLQYVEYWYSTYLEKTSELEDDDRSEMVEAFSKKLKDLMYQLFNHYKGENSSLYNDEQSSSTGALQNLVESATKHPKSKELFRGTLKRKNHGELLSDLDIYLRDEVFEVDEPQFNILAWWHEKLSTYRTLAVMARDILAIPVTSVASECAFSTAGRVLDPFRSSLTPLIVECLVCTQDWLRSPMQSISIEEKLETLEEIKEIVMAEMRALNLGSTS